MKHLKLKISGRVQGVFFRASAKEAADREGVTGVVRNEPDGSVYVEAEGEAENLERFVDWCRQGPPAAKVERVEVSDGALKGFSGFTVSR